MDYNSKFVDLLTSQQRTVFGFAQDSVELSSSQVPYSGTQAHEASNFAESPAERRQRRNWTPIDDLVLISAWLNTSKDPVVGNEQRCGTFWKRVAAYFAVSPKVAGSEQRESSNCKQRWQKINDIVNKFCGAYEAASREKSSGQNENDIWRELSTSKTHGSAKRRKCDDGAQSTTSNGTETTNGEEDQGATRPPGVKAAKGQRKKKDVADGKKKDLADGKKLYEFEGMCSIKREDLAMKEKLSKMKLLESLIAKPEPLADYEEALKKKLITDLSKRVNYDRLLVTFGVENSRSSCDLRLWNDYFSETPTYPDNLFRRRFRMNKPLFMHIVDRLSNEVEFFRQKQDCLGRLSLSPLQKCTAAIRCLAYGTAADTVDEYLRLGSTTTRSCLENFVEGIINLFGDEYLRRPTPGDLQRLLDIGEHRGFPGMIGSIDCMHWEWKNCPTAWKGTLNDINVLDRSPVFDDIIKGQVPQVNFFVNGREYHMAYYLTDGIYPKWATFIQSIPIPQGPKAVLFAQHQEAVRKDVERAFGVLQARFAIVKNPALFGDKVKIEKIMRACIILHNMIVEDERDGYTQYDVSEFQQGEDTGSSHVDLDFSTDMPTNIANMMGVRTRIRDRQMHQQLKADLVEHIWRK
ncbi:PREDICTED: uncharacterized protein LOC106338206, partial [Brassica oleracea var. oleracea]|uniref:uncharacterized protein LOC106338206 n=1 Tax=Brassica oleracea var. oleracea TaxID=109376 RepID=UPI0006A6B4A9